MEVDPRDAFAREGEDIGARDLPALADQIAGPKVPVDVGILEGKGLRAETSGPGKERSSTHPRDAAATTMMAEPRLDCRTRTFGGVSFVFSIASVRPSVDIWPLRRTSASRNPNAAREPWLL